MTELELTMCTMMCLDGSTLLSWVILISIRTAGSLSVGTIDIWSQRFLGVECCPVERRTSVAFWIHQADARSSLPCADCDNHKCSQTLNVPWKANLSLVQNHWDKRDRQVSTCVIKQTHPQAHKRDSSQGLLGGSSYTFFSFKFSIFLYVPQ